MHDCRPPVADCHFFRGLGSLCRAIWAGCIVNNSELFRAIRLVVDTGVHYKRWNRLQMTDYFPEHFGDPQNSEVDRYVAIPGQALGYKIGQLKILELRKRAQDKLGPAFDIRAFHDRVLGAGALPLDLLEERIDSWIASVAKR